MYTIESIRTELKAACPSPYEYFAEILLHARGRRDAATEELQRCKRATAAIEEEAQAAVVKAVARTGGNEEETA